MGTNAGVHAVSAWPCTLALLLPLLAMGAEPAPQLQSEPEQQELLEELDEVLVNGEKPVKSTQQVINWLASLAGRFTFEGSVDLKARGNPDDLKPVQGSANCVAFGLAPGVRCELKVRWPETLGPDGEPVPGGVSTLDPAMILYGLDPRSNGISHMLVDSKGVGERAIGLLFNNTLISKAPCASFSGICEREVRITVTPDLQVITMQIELLRDYRKVVSFAFLMRRVPGSAAEVVRSSRTQR